MPSNFNSTTPAAPAGFTNVVFQTDGNGNDSAYVPTSSGGPGGSSGDIQFNDGAGDFGGSAATINTAGSITIPEGQVIEWSGGYGPYSTAAISALASDTLAIGDGSPGDVSGAAAMTALILFGSSSYYDYNLFHTTIYSGAEQNWSLILPPNPGTSGQVLTTNGSGVTYWETPSGGGGGGGSVTSFSSGNLSPLFTTSVATPTTTPALSFSLNTQSPNTVFAGPVSGGAATPTFRALVAADLPAGTTPTPGGSSGDIQYNNAGAFGGSLATITAAGSLTLPDTQVIKWGGSAYSGVGLSQLAADTLAVGNGNESDVSGGMAMTALILYGSSYYSAYDAYQTTILSGALQDWSLVLPETAGTAGQVLTNIGSGFTAWESLIPISLTSGVSGILPVANGGTMNCNTQGIGQYVCIPFDFWEMAAATSACTVSASTNTYVCTFVLTEQVTFTKLTSMVDVLESGSTWYMALYSGFPSNSNSRVIGWSFSGATAGVITTTVSSTTLQPGVYTLAWSCTNASAALYGMNPGGDSIYKVMNANANRLGYYGSQTSGALPTSISGTFNSAGLATPFVLLEP